MQKINLYVGNLPYKTSEDELRDVFGVHGEVVSVSIIRDRQSGQSKGFGFVEMADRAAGETAIAQLNGFEFQGRKLKVNEAQPRSAGGDRGGRGGSGGGPRRW